MLPIKRQTEIYLLEIQNLKYILTLILRVNYLIVPVSERTKEELMNVLAGFSHVQTDIRNNVYFKQGLLRAKPCKERKPKKTKNK